MRRLRLVADPMCRIQMKATAGSRSLAQAGVGNGASGINAVAAITNLFTFLHEFAHVTGAEGFQVTTAPRPYRVRVIAY